jgi:hypothetical protein
MKKRLFTAILATCMLLTLAACGDNNHPAQETLTPSPAQSTELTQAVIPEHSPESELQTSANATVIPDVEPSEEAPPVNIDWQNVVCQYTDDNGYTFEVSITMSPWILQSNTSLINSAWETVGNEHSLPSISDWGMEKYAGNDYVRGFSTTNGRRFYANMTDMYYIVGTISVENLTDGWSFSTDSPGSTKISLDLLAPSDPTTKVISRIFYNNKEETYGGMLRVSPSFTSDKWGAVPFVIAYAELFNPNNPNGAYRNEVELAEFMLRGSMGTYYADLQQVKSEIQDTEADGVADANNTP